MMAAKIFKLHDKADDEDWVFVCPECDSIEFNLVLNNGTFDADFIGASCANCSFKLVFTD